MQRPSKKNFFIPSHPLGNIFRLKSIKTLVNVHFVYIGYVLKPVGFTTTGLH
jgi:hypothetical protein